MLDELEAEIGREQALADRLSEQLGGELAEVARYEHGLWPFLYGVVTDRHARLSREQETAAVIEVSLHEATAAIDELSRQRDVLAARRDALAPVAAEVEDLRAECLANLAGTPAGDEALVLVTRLAELEDEQRAVRHALAAGEAAQEPLLAIARVSPFRTDRRMDAASTYHDYANELRWLLIQLREHAGRASARLGVFRRALADLGLQRSASLPSPERRKVFFTSTGARPEYEAVWSQLLAVVQELAARLTELHARANRIDASIPTLEEERDRLL